MFHHTLGRLKSFPTENNSTSRLAFKVKLLILLPSLATVGLFLRSGFTDWLRDQFQTLSACEKSFSEDNKFLNPEFVIFL